jgi:PAS domain S-box-containing protein
VAIPAANTRQQAEALDRLTRLQALTASLSEAATSEQVADAILTQAAAVLDACAGVVYLLSDDDSELVLVRSRGYAEEATGPWKRFPAEKRTPISDAVRTRQPVLLTSMAERDARYSEIAPIPGVPAEGAIIALPLVIGERPIGGMGLRFPTDHAFSEQDRAFLLTGAGLCAQALERARLYDRERLARERAEHAEAAWRQSEERLRAIIDNCPSAIFVKDPTGRYLLANKACEVYSGEPVERAIGKTAHAYFPQGLANDLGADDRQVLETGEALRYEAVMPAQGETITTLVVKFPLRDASGRLYAVCGIATDITELKCATEALRASEERFVRFMQHLPGLAWIKDEQRRYVYANDAAVTAFGKPRSEIYGRTDEEVFPPATAAHFQENDRQALASGTGVRVVETLEQQDGVRHHSLVSKFPIPGPDGAASLVGGIAIDITEEIRTRAVLQESEERLREQAEQLREADRRKDDFLATLAHELRNPLAPLRTGLQVMKLASGNAESVEQARGMMERQMAVMVRLIDDLLDVSRITRGKLELRRQQVELASVVQSAVEASRPFIEASGHRLTIAMPPEPILLNADPTRLAQVFGNLLTNAAKYTDRGGQITLTASHRPGEVAVSVRDTGIGIAAEHLPRLFEMFSQVKTALERSQGGLGIGLALVKGLVEMHGGTVEAGSEGPGKGSEFIVRLPVAGDRLAPESAQPRSGEQAAGGHRKRILVADDNRDAADSLTMLLRLGGHEVHAVHDGQEAVDAAGWFRPDLALLDIGMPKLNGFEAARRIREQPWGRGMMLVAITGWGQEEDKRRAAEAGFDIHLTKPVDPATLEKVLAELRADGK